MDYTDAIIWYMTWPLVIWIAYKFVMVNLRHHAKMERLEKLEARFGEECEHQDPMINIDKKEKKS